MTKNKEHNKTSDEHESGRGMVELREPGYG